MNTRIRYQKTSQEGVLRSVKKFQHTTNGARYVVFIRPESLEYLVVNDVTDIIEVSGRAVNLHQVKIKAKDALKGLGISFEGESRVTEDVSTTVQSQDKSSPTLS